MLRPGVDADAVVAGHRRHEVAGPGDDVPRQQILDMYLQLRYLTLDISTTVSAYPVPAPLPVVTVVALVDTS